MFLFWILLSSANNMRHFTLSFCSIFWLLLFLLKMNIASSDAQRAKRFLHFPYRHSAVAQIITGIGIPVDLDLETVTMGVVFKSSFFLPMNSTDFTEPVGDPFDVQTHPINTFFTGRKRSIDEHTNHKMERDVNDNTDGFDAELNEKFERHEVQADIVDSGTEPSLDETSEFDDYNEKPSDSEETNLATMRWTAYKGLAVWAESHGLPGRLCVLRTICESAHTSFDYSNGVFGELLHVLLSPSVTNDEISEHSDYEYLRAEMLGKDGAPCEQVFKECKVSILHQFGGIYSPMMDVDSNKFLT